MTVYSRKSFALAQFVFAAASLLTPRAGHAQQPATQNSIVIQGEKWTTQITYVDGKVRFTLDTDKSDGERYERYYNEDGKPEKFITHGDGQSLITEFFYIGPYVKQVEYFGADQAAETWHLDGKLHREDGPAKTLFRPDGIFEEYYLDGKLDRKDGPAFIDQDVKGARWEKYYQKGLLHNDNGWAVFRREPDGTTHEEYYQNDKKHRGNGPAVILTGTDGSLREEYWLDGKLARRDGGPTVVITTLASMGYEWHDGDEFHREDGPAVVELFPDGTSSEKYYNHGTHIKTVLRDSNGQITSETLPANATETKPERNEGVTGKPLADGKPLGL